MKISIIGRPNVGKSTIFNRLTRTRHAIVHNMPGVTRDRREGKYILQGHNCILVDTPGLEETKNPECLEARMMVQTRQAVLESDLCLMVVDGRAGITPVDEFFASWLRQNAKNIITVVNKCEGNKGDVGGVDAYKLGFSPVITISAEHNENIGELEDNIAKMLKLKNSTKKTQDKKTQDKKNKKIKTDKASDTENGTRRNDAKKTDVQETDVQETNFQEVDPDEILHLAIIGRPNTGKSTFFNKLFGAERVLTGPEAGITRDSIAAEVTILGKKIKLVDTAGIRKKANVQKTVEKLSVGESLHTIRFCHVAILLLDATCALEKQDLTLLDMIANEGRAAIVVLNKWDKVIDKEQTLKEVELRLNEIMQQVKDISIVTISALYDRNVDKVVKLAFKVYDTWNRRISTAKLNNWLSIAAERHIPPLGNNGRRIKMKYITQGNIRPPTFTLFVNNCKDLPKSYKRYLVNSLRDELNLPGVPIRLMVRSSSNPYKK